MLTSTNNGCILCVDDNEDHAELLKFCFEREGFEVVGCGTAADHLDHLKRREFAAIVLDYWLSDRDGADVCQELKRDNPHTPILFFSSDARNPLIMWRSKRVRTLTWSDRTIWKTSFRPSGN